jgi:MFS family permease
MASSAFMLKSMLTIYFTASWRWIFWINIPIVGIGYVMVAFFLKLHHTKAAPFVEQLKRIDWFGSFLFIASTTSILIPISWVCTTLSLDHTKANVHTRVGFPINGILGKHLSH